MNEINQETQQNQIPTPSEVPTNGVVQQKTPTKKTYTRSVYMFPAYDFSMAKMIAETVERNGAGTLTEETLAITLNLSAKSSGFILKSLTARQFGLLEKHQDVLTTTTLAKSIFKPTNEDEKRKALVESFLKIPLFQAVATRFKGESIPGSETFRNILEREFKIDCKRVSDAERVLMDSARDTGVLINKENMKYLSVGNSAISSSIQQSEADKSIQDSPLNLSIGVPSVKPSSPGKSMIGTVVTPQTGMLPGIAEEDLLGLTDDEFKDFWGAFGKIVRNRAKKSQNEVKELDNE